MLKKYLILVLIFSFCTIALLGCAQEKTKEADTFMVIDQIGREVAIPKDVETIVSAYYVTTSLLIALGAEERLVGIEMKADERELYKRVAPQLLDLPAVGSSKGLNMEEIAALAPDLVIIPYRLQEMVPQFDALEIPVLVVEPESMSGFLDCVTLLGKATNTKERAFDLVAYYEETMTMVNHLTKDLGNRPKVYLAGSGDVLTTCTSLMYQHELIEMAGGVNASSELTAGYWVNISAEQLIQWNPAYILPVSYANYDLEDVSSNPALAEIEALEMGQLAIFPSQLEPWDYPTPSSILGILWLTSTLHPNLYSQEAYLKAAEDFYKTYYNLAVTPAELGL